MVTRFTERPRSRVSLSGVQQEVGPPGATTQPSPPSQACRTPDLLPTRLVVQTSGFNMRHHDAFNDLVLQSLTNRSQHSNTTFATLNEFTMASELSTDGQIHTVHAAMCWIVSTVHAGRNNTFGVLV